MGTRELRAFGAALIAAAYVGREVAWPHGWPERFHLWGWWRR